MSMTLLQRYATVATTALFPVIAISGVLMFFEIGGPLKEAHEWLGMAFVVAVLLHLVRNWAMFTKLFKHKRTYALLGLAALATLAFSAEGLMEGGGGGNPMRNFIQQASTAPITSLAPVMGQTPEAMMDRLSKAGIAVTSADQSLKQLADANDAEMPKLLAIITNQATEEDED